MILRRSEGWQVASSEYFINKVSEDVGNCSARWVVPDLSQVWFLGSKLLSKGPISIKLPYLKDNGRGLKNGKSLIILTIQKM